MGNAHTHRNKRGGRHNRGGGASRTPGPSTSASASTSGLARPAESSAQPVPAPAPHTAPHTARASDTTPATPTAPQRTGTPGGRSRGEPSLRAPYAPGQRIPRSPRQPEPPVEDQTLELEVAATSYEEFVVTTRGMETAEDQGGALEPVADHGEGYVPPGLPARADHLPPPTRHNGHANDAGRRNGRGRDRERDHERTDTASYERPPSAWDDDHAETEAEMLAGEDHEAPDAPPRGDVRGEVGALIDDLKALFQRDRTAASATGGTRCGICYLHFALDELEYRDDEGYYICAGCSQALGSARVPMVRRQKRG